LGQSEDKLVRAIDAIRFTTGRYSRERLSLAESFRVSLTSGSKNSKPVWAFGKRRQIRVNIEQNNWGISGKYQRVIVKWRLAMTARKFAGVLGLELSTALIVVLLDRV
jgi:hypothetical protein